MRRFCHKIVSIVFGCRTHQHLLNLGVVVMASFEPTRAMSSDETFKQSKKLEKRAIHASTEIDRYVGQLNRTEQALASVSKAREKELKKRYNSFAEEVSRLQREQRHVTTEVERLEGIDAAYFVCWEEANARISNSELQQASADRRAKALQERDKLATSLSAIGSQLQPFMTNLHDLEEFLGADLSAANIGKASEMILESQADARSLKDKISEAQATLRRIEADTPK